MIEVTLAGPPLGKERVRLNRHTLSLHTPERTLTYEARLAAEGQHVMGNRPLLDGPIAISLDIYMPVPVSKSKKFRAAALAGLIRPVVKPDFDNVAKILGDGLNLVVWRDDCEIVSARIDKFYSERPRIVLRAWEWKPDEPAGTGVFG